MYLGNKTLKNIIINYYVITLLQSLVFSIITIELEKFAGAIGPEWDFSFLDLSKLDVARIVISFGFRFGNMEPNKNVFTFLKVRFFSSTKKNVSNGLKDTF